MLAGLAYDGLVAYRRVPGVAGGTLVGGLATRPPAPSADGRTYVFTLRRGIRYSDGTPVRPGDFRASMERYLGAPSFATFPPYFSGIVGARRCIRAAGAVRPLARHRVGCARADDHGPPDRARPGVPPQADDRRSPTWCPPARPRMRHDPGLAPPGTGPYRIASWDVRRGGVLVRNPHFRPTAARPAGFADRIEIKVTGQGRARDAHRGDRPRQRGSDVARGLPPARQLPDLVARAPGRLHSSPLPGASWMFLNVRRPPFDDLRVRQALNFAVDRAELVELYGGPEAAAPTCQIVTPGVPGLSPVLPLHRRPGSAAAGGPRRTSSARAA